MAESAMYYAAEVSVFGANDLDSLASSSTLLDGRESNVIDNTSNKYLDAILSGIFKTNNTTPTAGVIQVWVGALVGDSAYPDVFDGTGSAESVVSAGIRNSALKLAHSIDVEAAANRVYPFTGVSARAAFGGTLPPKWFVFVTHNTVQALNASTGLGGTVYYQGVKITP
jgi:hypothetical protein